MKAFKMVLKILVALAAVAGAVYVVATYGDKLVAWARRLLDKLNCCCCDCCDCDCDCNCECDCCDCEEVEITEGAIEAEDKDFES